MHRCMHADIIRLLAASITSPGTREKIKQRVGQLAVGPIPNCHQERNSESEWMFVFALLTRAWTASSRKSRKDRMSELGLCVNIDR